MNAHFTQFIMLCKQTKDLRKEYFKNRQKKILIYCVVLFPFSLLRIKSSNILCLIMLLPPIDYVTCYIYKLYTILVADTHVFEFV